MKKKNVKSKKAKKQKIVLKELKEKLQDVISHTLQGYGKTKKNNSIIEKFAKKLAKKVSFKPLEIKPVGIEPIPLTTKSVEQSKKETSIAKKVSKAKPRIEKK